MDDTLQFCHNCRRDVGASNFRLHSAYCERNIKVCRHCSEPILSIDYDKHLEDAHSFAPCSECYKSIEKCTIDVHKKKCVKRNVSCLYCDLQLPFCSLSDHVEACSSRTEKCLKCNKYVMLKEIDAHKDICNKNQISEICCCNFCGLMVSYSEMLNHVASCAVALEQKWKRENQSSEKTLSESTDITQLQNLEEAYSMCPICERKVMDDKLISHLSVCSKGKKICKFCCCEFLKTNEKEHLKTCPALWEDNFTVAENSKKARNCNNQHFLTCCFCKEHISKDMFVDHYQTCLDNANNSYQYKSDCVKKEHNECYAVNENQSENRIQKKHKKKEKASVWSRFKGPFTSILQGEAKQTSEEINKRCCGGLSHENYEIITLPCEFCTEMIPEYNLIEHQSGCRPDLTSLPKNNEEQSENCEGYKCEVENYASAMPSAENVWQIKYMNSNSKSGNFTKPGEFLEYYPHVKNSDRKMVLEHYDAGHQEQRPIGAERKENLKKDFAICTNVAENPVVSSEQTKKVFCCNPRRKNTLDNIDTNNFVPYNQQTYRLPNEEHILSDIQPCNKETDGAAITYKASEEEIPSDVSYEEYIKSLSDSLKNLSFSSDVVNKQNTVYNSKTSTAVYKTKLGSNSNQNSENSKENYYQYFSNSSATFLNLMNEQVATNCEVYENIPDINNEESHMYVQHMNKGNAKANNEKNKECLGATKKTSVPFNKNLKKKNYSHCYCNNVKRPLKSCHKCWSKKSCRVMSSDSD